MSRGSRDERQLPAESGADVSKLFEFAGDTDRSLSRWEHWFMDANGNVRSGAGTILYSDGFMGTDESTYWRLHPYPR